MRFRVLPALILALALGLAACGEDAPTDEAAPAPDGNGHIEVDISAIDMEFVPDEITVPSGSTVTFNLTNDGNLEHDLMFDDGSASGVLQAGESTSFDAGPFTADTVGWCDVPGHREAGMELEVIVE